MSTLDIAPSEGPLSPLFEITWEQDQQYRMDPATVTALLREQVPVLEFVQWTINSIEPGWTESVLPLNPQSTNQHFTHQAALFLLAGDYTGGTALASLLTGWPVIGVHPVTSPKSVSMWLLRAEMKYMRPSVGDLTVSARVDPAVRNRVQNRFAGGKAVIEAIKIEFRNGDVMVAEASLTYFARQSDKLRAEGISTARVNSLYELKLTSSAELIAGVRARENGKIYRDDHAENMAGPHGMALATRFCERSPQLGGMVAARTWHLDTAIANYVASGGRDIAIVGVGWDMRAFRLPLPAGTRVFELDFPTTLAERSCRLSNLGISDQPGVQRIQIPIDVRTMPLGPVLSEHIISETPLFVAWEGMNMYLQEGEVQRVLEGMLPLMRHPDSLLWLDLVDHEAILHPESFPESVRDFMRGMQILGEPFTFGPASVDEFLRKAGLRPLEIVPSDICLGGTKDPVYDIYKFCVAASASNATRVDPLTFRKTRIDKKSRSPAQPHVGNESPVTKQTHGGKRSFPR